jgi:hypothetical protein
MYPLEGGATSTLHLLVGAVHEQHRLGGVIKHSSIPLTIPAFDVPEESGHMYISTDGLEGLLFCTSTSEGSWSFQGDEI